MLQYRGRPRRDLQHVDSQRLFIRRVDGSQRSLSFILASVSQIAEPVVRRQDAHAQTDERIPSQILSHTSKSATSALGGLAGHLASHPRLRLALPIGIGTLILLTNNSASL
jgi:hypothetical protein